MERLGGAQKASGTVSLSNRFAEQTALPRTQKEQSPRPPAAWREVAREIMNKGILVDAVGKREGRLDWL